MRKPLLLLFLSWFLSLASAAESDSLLYRFSWTVGDKDMECSLHIDDQLLDYYRNEREHLAYKYSTFNAKEPMTPANFYGFMFSEYGREVVRDLVSQLVDSTMSRKEMVAAALSFVQSLPYVQDHESKGQDEYVRYPVETLADGVGDCEDKSLLLGAIFLELGMDFILLTPPDHLAIGVSCEGIEAKRSFLVGNQQYYYLETTSPNWKIGQIPEEYAASKFDYYPLKTTSTLVVKGVWFESAPSTSNLRTPCTLKMDLLNVGPGRATNLKVHLMMLEEDRKGYRILMEDVRHLKDVLEGEERNETIAFKSLLSDNCLFRVVLSGKDLEEQVIEMDLHTKVFRGR